MALQKLVVQEFIVDEDILSSLVSSWKIGDRCAYFIDPETGLSYRPKAGFTVTGDSLEDLFVLEAFEDAEGAAAKENS